MRRWPLLALVTAVLLFSAPLAAKGAWAQAARPQAFVLKLKGPVTPVIQAYIERGLREAQSQGAACVILMLNTPGGSLNVTREVVQAMQAAQIPVVVYVAPSGDTAASAGTIITLAAHVAAMAPGTSIGAASPVSMQGELGETERRKAENIVIADLKALAARRPPEAQEWVEKAVRESAALTAEEALELGVIDIMAVSTADLLRQLDEREVRVQERTLRLQTAAAAERVLPMNALEQFLHTILDPNIALILLTIGVNALLFELSSPGGYVAGIVGAICLILGFFALGVLSVNWAGLGLMLLAFALFVAEVKAPTHGILMLLGLVCFVLGALVLFNSPVYRVSRTLVAAVALFSAAFFGFVVAKAVGAQHRPATTGRESLIGAIGTTRQELAPEGLIFVRGELWRARSRSGTIPAGEPVRIVAAEGLTLVVEPLVEAAATNP